MKSFSILLFTSLLLFSALCFSQTDDGKSKKKKSKFQTGLLIGSYFANRYTASLYDGYGYDETGKKNDFVDYADIQKSSFMYRRIILEYGGAYGQADQIAQALGVDRGQWTFDQTDMPVKMRYAPAITVGMQLCYAVTKKDALLLNINAAKLTLGGNFTIVLNTPVIGTTPPGYENIKTFAITGAEERLMLQPGYRRILGDDEAFNFFIEAGPSLNMTKYLRNDITINNLHIDLSSYYTQAYYPTFHARYLRGVGMGAFAGFGLNITANPDWSLQLLYSPSFEKINIGEASKFSLQHAIGIRAFYTI